MILFLPPLPQILLQNPGAPWAEAPIWLPTATSEPLRTRLPKLRAKHALGTVGLGVVTAVLREVARPLLTGSLQDQVPQMDPE